jgi:ABC-2 type transport system permease protein
MSGLGPLLRKELLEQVRTMRLFVVAIVFALFGILSPLTAKYLPEIVKAVAGSQLPSLVLPTPRTADAVDQLLKNVAQFGVLTAILLAMGAVAGEKERGTAAMLLTKPASRAAFLLAKLLAIGLNLLVATVVAAALGYYYTLVLFEPLPLGGYVAMTLLLWLELMAYATLTFLGSTLAPSPAAGAGLGVLFLVVTGIVSALPSIGAYTPPGLLGPARALALGQPGGDLGAPLAATLVLVVAAVALSWLAFRRQEL